MLPQERLLVQPATQEAFYVKSALKVMNLNLAHGRKDGLNQLLLRKSTIGSNLEDIADVLRQIDADVVALQEADGPSRWSGNFDHVEQLAEQSSYPAYVRTSHASSWIFNYGTALMSRAPFADVLHHTFQPSPPTMNKGFTLGQIVWQPDAELNETLIIDVISVHLDFSRKYVREQQVADMSEVLAGRDNPMIIMGDFNSDWFADEQVVRALAEESGLHVYRPEAKDLGTYNSSGRRLDWILISEELEFTNYRVLPDLLSDHLAVVATIELKQPDR
jgi:endonuclease/exonuclease/phosphatase family metal-dependent hydrolase